MPYPSQINPDTLVNKAREMIEAEGVEQVSLHKLAAALGVKAPSLYRYFDSKTALLRAVNLKTSEQMTGAMQAAADTSGDACERMLAMAVACRNFGLAYPMTYLLAFTNANPELRPDNDILEAMAIPLQKVMADISGEAHSLAALRGAWGLINGFILLELNGQFQRGGDLESAFVLSVQAYLEGWQRLAIGN
jgi:AcrR family transcriptional regulator